MRRRTSSAGLTLIELLIVLVLATLLLGVAAPAFQQSLQRLRLQAAVNDLLAAIDLTRSQAIARGGKVLMAPLDPAGTNWQQGWAVFIDHNGNRRPDTGEVLYRHDALREDTRITSRFTSGNAPTYVAYNAAGRTCSAASSLTARWARCRSSRETMRVTSSSTCWAASVSAIPPQKAPPARAQRISSTCIRYSRPISSSLPIVIRSQMRLL